MKSNSEEFIKNLKFYREKFNITQAQLAEKCDCSNGLIGSIESGKSRPSFDMIIKMADALGIHPADLFFREASASKKNLRKQIHTQLIASIEKTLDDNIPV